MNGNSFVNKLPSNYAEKKWLGKTIRVFLKWCSIDCRHIFLLLKEIPLFFSKIIINWEDQSFLW